MKFGKNHLFKETKIHHKLVLSFLLISLVPLSFNGVFTYLASKRAIANKIKDYSQESLTQKTVNISGKLEGYENISFQLIANTEVSSILTTMINSNDFFERYNMKKLFTQYLGGFKYNDEHILDMVFLNLEHESIYSLSDRVPKSFLESLPFKNFCQKINSTELAWSSLLPITDISGNTINSIIVGRKIQNNTNEDIGIFFVFIEEKSLDNLLNHELYLKEESTMLNKSTIKYSMLLDKQGQIISSPFKEYVGNNLNSFIKEDKPLDLLLGSTESETYSILDQTKVLLTCKPMENNWYILGVSPVSYLFDEISQLRWITYSLLILVGIFAFVVSWKVSKGISTPLNQVVNAMKLTEDGDLQKRTHINSRDELGYLGNAFNNMVEKFSTLILETKKAIQEVVQLGILMDQSAAEFTRTSEGVATAMEQITKGTMEQSTETEQTSSQILELAGGVDRVIQRTTDIEGIAQSTKGLGSHSQQAMKQLLEKSQETGEITDLIVRNINELTTEAKEIEQIIEAITNFAEQANLLAVNTAIEAARAGDAGRGFAVLAKKINRLSVQSKEAADNIGNILTGIQNKALVSAEIAEKAHQTVDEHIEAVNIVSKNFEEIIFAMDEAVTMANKVRLDLAQVNDFKESSVSSILNINSISEETAAAAEEVSSAAEEQTSTASEVQKLATTLKEMAVRLENTIKVFKI